MSTERGMMVMMLMMMTTMMLMVMVMTMMMMMMAMAMMMMMMMMVMMVLVVKVKVKVTIEIESPPVAPQQTHRLIQKTMSELRSNDFSQEIRDRFSLLYLYFQDTKPMKCFRKMSNGKR